MSAVIAVPELMVQAATDFETIGETLNAAHLTAAVPTVAVLPAAADEVSTGIAHLFSGYGQEYQKLAGEAEASYEQFAQHLTASAGAYAGAEAANAASLQPSAESGTIAGLLQQLGLFDPLSKFAAVALSLQAYLIFGTLIVGAVTFPFSIPVLLLEIGVLLLEFAFLASIGIIHFTPGY